jgi:hypothetical protein
VYGEGDSYSTQSVVGVTDDLETAKKYINSLVTNRWDKEFKSKFEGITKVSPDMTRENNFTFVGNWSDINQDCPYTHFGGFVIEQQHIITRQDVKKFKIKSSK